VPTLPPFFGDAGMLLGALGTLAARDACLLLLACWGVATPPTKGGIANGSAIEIWLRGESCRLGPVRAKRGYDLPLIAGQAAAARRARAIAAG
jgi:hypothetical protein